MADSDAGGGSPRQRPFVSDDQSCPECEGIASHLLSPGLVRCDSEIRWVEQELVTRYAAVDDLTMFYNFGLRGTTTVERQEWVEVEKSRVCNRVFEVDTPMSSTFCLLGPAGKDCGAFAVGHCSDCATPVCRYHGRYFDDRLMCDRCRGLIEAQRAESAARELEARRAAAAAAERAVEREAQRVRNQQAAEQAAYERLPAMSLVDWAEFMLSDDKFNDNQRPLWDGKRPVQLTYEDAADVFAALKFRKRRVRNGRSSKGWVVAEETGERRLHGDLVEYQFWAVLLESGQCIGCLEYKGDMSPAGAGQPSWRPTASGMLTARSYLRR